MTLAQELPDLSLETLLIARGYSAEEARQIAEGKGLSRRELPLSVAVAKYLDEGLAVPSLTNKTYRHIIRQYLEWQLDKWKSLPEEERTIDRIRSTDISRFANRPKLNGTTRHPNTVSKEISAISTMFEWLKRAGLTTLNPADNCERPAKVSPLPVALSEEEQQKLLDLSRQTECGLRNHTIITLALNTGLRASEVCRLTKSDVDFTAKTLKVMRSKKRGHPVEVVPLLPVVLNALDYYLKASRNRIAAPGCHDFLFLNTKGKNWGRPMTVAALETMMKPLLTKLGKGEGINFHVLRHSYAMNLLRRGVPLLVIKTLLGHASVETSQTYLRLHDEEVRSVLARAFPEGVLVPGTARDVTNMDLQQRLNELFAEED